MDQVKLNNLRDTLKRTLEKVLDEGKESSLDFRKIYVIYERMVDKCEGDKKMAVEIMRFVTKDLLNDLGVDIANSEIWEKLTNPGMFF